MLRSTDTVKLLEVHLIALNQKSFHSVVLGSICPSTRNLIAEDILLGDAVLFCYFKLTS